MPYLNIQIRHCEYQYFIFGKDRIHRNYQIEFYAEVFGLEDLHLCNRFVFVFINL